MQNNSINSQTDIANVTVVTEENQIIVPQPITNVIEVNNPGPQGPIGPTGPQGPSVPFTNIGGDVFATTSSLQVTGSFLVSGSSTFTNIGPAIFSGSANIVGVTTMSSALVTGNVTVLGTASIGTLVVNQTVLSTGSNQLGDSANDTQTLYGSVIIPTGSLTITGSLTVSGSTATQLLVGSNLLFVSSSGNVGIGISSPAITAGFTGTHIKSATNFGSELRLDTTDADRNASLTFSTANTNKWQMFLDSTNGSLKIRDMVSPVTTPLTILDGGNVGIGTSTPAYPLDVNGTIRSQGQLIVVGQIQNPTIGVVDVNGVLYSGTGVSIGVNSTNAAKLLVRGSGTTSATTALRVENTNASASLVVLDNGNVGINTGSADYNLDVNGTIRVGGFSYFTAYFTAVQRLQFNNGSVATNWGQFRGQANGVFRLVDSSEADFNRLQFGGGTTSFPALQRVSASIAVVDATGGNSGSLLINTTSSAGYALDVNGTARFTNNLTITGSATISNILTLTPQSPLPSGVATGSFAVSSSVPPKPYFYDGTTWNALY
jgi:hypothetical protein